MATLFPLAYDSHLADLPDDGWDWAMTQGLDDLAHGRKPALLCALQVVVFGDQRGRGVSGRTVQAMKAIGQTHGLPGMIAPVRPSQKCDYPLTVAEWESWTGMRFPDSGDYIVPGALVPVQIDRENDRGLYVEPNVWMYHPPDQI